MEGLAHLRLGDRIRKPGEIVSLSSEAVGIRFDELAKAPSFQSAVGCCDTAAPTKPKLGQFWMVYRIGSLGPTYRHMSLVNAEIEADRLARENPGTNFVVLEARQVHHVDLPPVQREVFEIPF